MGNWSSSDVVANGVRLHVVRTGGDHPPLVLAHGMSCQGSQWVRMARILEADYDIIMYDARSHGHSEAAPLELEDLADDLVGLVGALHLEQPCLSGTSMGAWTVALAASRHPDLARAVVLDELPFDLSWWLSEQWVQGGRAEKQKRKAMPRDELMALFRAVRQVTDEETLTACVEGELRFAVEQFQVRRGPNIMMTDVVRRIACPVLMLVGDADKGSVLTPDMEREYAQIGGHVQVVHVAGAGHGIFVQQPEAWVRIVSAFLGEQSVKR